MTAGNVTVPTTAVRYGVQVTASISVGEEINEGQLSPVTDIFVPEGGEFLGNICTNDFRTLDRATHDQYYMDRSPLTKVIQHVTNLLFELFIM